MKKLPKLLNTPARVVIAVGAIVLVTELFIMTIIHDAIAPLNAPDVYWDFIDAFLLTLIVSPALYFMVFRKMHKSETRYHSLFENMLNGFAYCRMQYDDHGRPVDFVYLNVNEAFGRLTGLKDVVGKLVSEVIPGIREQHPELFEIYGRVAATGIPAIFDIDLKLLDKWFTISAYSPEPGEGYFVAVFEDITERKQIEAALLESEERMRAIMDNTSTVIFLKDLAGRYLHVNRRYEELFHVSNTAIRGKTDHDIFPRDMADAFIKHDQIVVQSGQPLEVEEQAPHDDGIHTYISVKFPLHSASGEIYAVCGIATDITERKQAEEQIRQLAFYDLLTGLPNRRLLNDRLSQTLAASKRSGRYGALMFMDLDNFKPLNDTHGHGVGDLLLIEVAHRLTSCVREVDTVARFGGDEFVVILSDLDADKTESLAQASIVAEKIRATLAEPYVLTIPQECKAETVTIEHHCTSSIGVVLFISYESSAKDILKWADRAMYQAKGGGRNLIRFYDSKA